MKFGVDKAILYTSLVKILQALGGFVTLFLIGTFMSKEEQGFYYTFASVLAIQVFFELGLGGIISQFVAHEMAHLQIKDRVHVLGDLKHVSRLNSLLHFCFKWYSVFAILLFVVLQMAGYYFFSKYGRDYPDVKWQIPWMIVAVGGALNLLLSPWMAVLQGMNKVKEMAKISLIQQLTVMFITWISLVLGAKLYISAINSMASVLVLLGLYIRSEYPALLLNLYKTKLSEQISYAKEIFPLQWKIAVSWISGYFIFQFFNPIIFAFNGPVAAGKMGMTLTVLNAILFFTLTWTGTKVPLWSMFIARREFTELDASLKGVLKQSSIVCFIAISIAISCLFVFKLLNLPIYERFLPVGLCVLLFSSIPINNIITIWATYLRCFKKEPFLVQAVSIGLFSGLSTYITAKFFGVQYVVAGYVCITAFLSLPISYYIFKTKRIQYHGS
ncbi:MAG: hypothetical protein QM727_03995 [Niabella sp.]